LKPSFKALLFNPLSILRLVAGGRAELGDLRQRGHTEVRQHALHFEHADGAVFVGIVLVEQALQLLAVDVVYKEEGRRERERERELVD